MLPAASITGADVAKYANLRLDEEAAPATVNRELALLRRAFRLAIRQGLLAAMPVIMTLRRSLQRSFELPPRFRMGIPAGAVNISTACHREW